MMFYEGVQLTATHFDSVTDSPHFGVLYNQLLVEKWPMR